MKPTYFATPAEFRRWLQEHHARAAELWVGYHKRDSGTPSLTWPESVDQALCFGWIDGVRKRVDERRYVIRFTPRRPGSAWSAINIRRAKQLVEEGLMRPAGLRAFEARLERKSVIYAYEQPKAELAPGFAKRFRGHRAAWAFFQAQPPWYRKRASWWVMSAKQEETRLRRLERLIQASALGKRA